MVKISFWTCFHTLFPISLIELRLIVRIDKGLIKFKLLFLRSKYDTTFIQHLFLIICFDLHVLLCFHVLCG